MLSQIKNLDALPKPSIDSHQWADYIELLCLFNIDGMVSKADLLDRAQDRKDLGGELEELEDELSNKYGSEEDDDSRIDVGASDTELSTAELDDEWDVEATGWFNHLKYRSAIFGDFYPFIISDDTSLLTRQSEISEKHKLYLFLLFVSNLKYFKKYISKFTFSFEIISWEVMKCFLPGVANVHVFSRNPQSDRQYSGLNLWNKIKKLESDIKDKIIVNESEFAPTDNADNGLDIVGWVPFHKDETVDGLLVVFGQCACGLDWYRKQYESSIQNWGATMRLKAPPNNMVFIPFCFRNSDGTWYRQHDIQRGTILIDRPRLIYILNEKYEIFKAQPSYAIVEELLKQRESIF